MPDMLWYGLSAEFEGYDDCLLCGRRSFNISAPIGESADLSAETRGMIERNRTIDLRSER